MSDSESKPGEKKLVTIKNATDLQRLRLEKLMKNPDKPVLIPERPRSKALASPPDFVRNVMGSSAGAGSGEFHVYRHLRRKEYARQKFIQEKSEKEKLDEEYHRKIEQNKKQAEEKTAKKRAKRLRKKNNARGKKPKTQNRLNVSSQSDSNSEDDDNEVNEEGARQSGDIKLCSKTDKSDGEVNCFNKKSNDNQDNNVRRDEIDSGENISNVQTELCMINDKL